MLGDMHKLIAKVLSVRFREVLNSMFLSLTMLLVANKCFQPRIFVKLLRKCINITLKRLMIEFELSFVSFEGDGFLELVVEAGLVCLKWRDSRFLLMVL